VEYGEAPVTSHPNLFIQKRPMDKSTVPLHHLHNTKTRRPIANLIQGLGLAGLIMFGGIQAGISHGGEVTEQSEAEERSAEEIFRLVQDYTTSSTISQIMRAQAGYLWENQHFASSLEALDGDWPQTTEHYQFELVVKEPAVFIVAHPTHPDLHSFIGVAQRVEREWGELIVRADCRSPEPTAQIPTLEVLTLGNDDLALECPDGFDHFGVGIAQTYIGALNRSQQARRMESPQFSADIEGLNLGMPTETEFHRFEIVAEAGTEDLIAVQLSLPKYDSIPAYMGIATVIETEGDQLITAILCGATESAGADIVMPIRTAATDPPTECPAGFEQL
jgi:hypothetical protein